MCLCTQKFDRRRPFCSLGYGNNTKIVLNKCPVLLQVGSRSSKIVAGCVGYGILLN